MTFFLSFISFYVEFFKLIFLGFMGYASDLYNFISAREVESSTMDDQLFYSKLFIDKQLREKHRVKLDYKSNIFFNLNGATGKHIIF